MIDYFAGGEGVLTPSDAAAALIVLRDGRYLMQLRDQMPGVYYPDHWGLFGGALEAGESAEAALQRELQEEIRLTLKTKPRFFTEFTFDFSFNGYGRVRRAYYEVQIEDTLEHCLVLREGREMRAFAPKTILNHPRVVPYDSFAIWLHATQQTSGE